MPDGKKYKLSNGGKTLEVEMIAIFTVEAFTMIQIPSKISCTDQKHKILLVLTKTNICS